MISFECSYNSLARASTFQVKGCGFEYKIEQSHFLRTYNTFRLGFQRPVTDQTEGVLWNWEQGQKKMATFLQLKKNTCNFLYKQP